MFAGIDVQHGVHLRQVQQDAPVDGVGATGEPGARAARHHRHATFRADADDRLHLGLGPGADAGRGCSGRSPLGVVVRQGHEHVSVRNDAIAVQPATEGLDQRAGVRHHPRAAVTSSATAVAPAGLMIEAA